jgi:hypothetical protein
MQPKNREELDHFQDNKDENVTAGPQKDTVIVASRKQRGSLPVLHIPPSCELPQSGRAQAGGGKKHRVAAPFL